MNTNLLDWASKTTADTTVMYKHAADNDDSGIGILPSLGIVGCASAAGGLTGGIRAVWPQLNATGPKTST